MIYGEKMNEIRNDNNLKQKDVAEIMNISPYTYSHFETGDTLIPIKRLIFFCDYFNVSLDYILGLSNIKNYQNYRKDFDLKLSAKRLKEFRKDNNLTQMKLINLLNCGKGTLANYEVGSNIIALQFLYEICSKYNISADYLLGKTDNPKYLN